MVFVINNLILSCQQFNFTEGKVENIQKNNSCAPTYECSYSLNILALNINFHSLGARKFLFYTKNNGNETTEVLIFCRV